jgi:hypothetical protein
VIVNMRRFPSVVRRVWSLSITAVIVGMAGSGCTGGPSSQLTVTSNGSQNFVQTFAIAYYSQDSDGDTHIILMDDAARRTLDGETVAVPVRQVMHIRVLWKPSRDLKADHNSASNATIHWYVIGNSPKASGVLEYAGTAVVVLEAGDRSTELSIRTGSFHAVACRGALRDPLGPASLRGTVRATESVARVRLALKSVKSAVASANNIPADVTVRSAPELPSSSAR